MATGISAGMVFLVGSVVCSVSVSVLLKLARRNALDVRWMIAMNYVAALALAQLLLRPSWDAVLALGAQWPLWLALGLLLPTVFMAMALSVRHAGIVRSDAAQRLSLVIALLAAFALFGQVLTQRKTLAIVVVFVALGCLLWRRSERGAQTGARSSMHMWLWPLLVWVGYGVIDVLFKRMAQSGAAFANTLAGVFVIAGVLIWGWLLLMRVRPSARSLAAGVVLGVLNFANIYTYIRAHQSLPQDPALVFAGMNMGVVALGAVVGAAAFGEKLSRTNYAGLALALVAIALLMP